MLSLCTGSALCLWTRTKFSQSAQYYVFAVLEAKIVESMDDVLVEYVQVQVLLS